MKQRTRLRARCRHAVAGISAALAACTPAAPSVGPAPAIAEGEYVAYVASEAADQVSRVVFGPAGIRVDRRREVGTNPADVDGPHGVAVSPDGRFYYVTIAHGTPFGSLWKISTASDSVVGEVRLGLFPATADVTPDGEYAFVVNFNLHGDHVPSTVSKVHLPSMTETARTETCVMPHGSRVNAQGTKQYSACMMDDLLVEVDVATARVSRRFSVRPGMEGLADAGAHGGHEAHGGRAAAAAGCSPTWAQPSVDGALVYVACNRSDEVLEVDTRSWRVTRRFATGDAPYNLAVTPDGRYLLATLKNRTEPAIEVIELAGGTRAARVPSTTTLPHGVVVTEDSRYAFVSVEGVGSEPGKVDVIDLATLQRVASVGVGPQAGGIALAPSGRTR